MFLCKRQIDINARFGLPRIAFMSAVATIIMFLVSYEVMYFLSNTPLSDRHFLIFLLLVFMTYPLHKSIHLLFFLPYRKSFKVHKLTKRKWLIFYNTYANQPVHKFYFCINLILPLIILSAMFVYLTILFPQYGHYFMFLLALNFGISITDLLYLKIIIFSNYGQYIEEHSTGINILKKIKNPYHL